jgi:tRNA modification GTPase
MPTVADQQTWAVVLTPPGRGAVASILIDGPDTVSCIDAHVSLRRAGGLTAAPLRRVLIGRWSTADGEKGEEIVVCRHDDRRVEVHCHGGPAAADRIMEALAAAGCRQISWEDWIERGLRDHFVAAAARLLPQARTARTASILLDQYNGALRAELESIAASLKTNNTNGAAEQLRTLLHRAPLGQHLVEPWRVVIAGPPNVGKSTLINNLVGFPRAIVFDQPGTTRDVVTATTVLDGWPVELADTAGLHDSTDPLELAGIDRANLQLESSDQVIFVFDATQPATAIQRELADQWPDAICVLNKIDLIAPPNSPAGWLCISARTGEGIPLLIETLVSRLVPQAPPPGAGVPITTDQIDAFRSILTACETAHAATALNQLRALLA